MKKQLNANYVFLFYDVNEKRVQKVFKVCKKYLVHYQNSVFRGHITPSKILALKKELEKIIKKKEDFVSIVMLMNEHSFSEIKIGQPAKSDGEALFL